MSIGWKANYGYFQSTSVKPLPTLLSDITFTDINRPFTISTHPIQFIEYSSSNSNISADSVGIKYNSIVEFQSALENAIGNDFYTIYLTPIASGRNLDGSYDVLSSHIPSSTKSCPNLFKYAELNKWSMDLYRCIYIPALNRVIVGYDVLSVDGGSLVRIYHLESSSYPPYRFNGSDFVTTNHFYGGFGCAPFYDGTPESIYNNEIYFIQFAASATIHKICVNKGPGMDSDSGKFLKAIFSDFVPPDIDTTNPYSPGGNSATGTLPPGTFDDSSDSIPDSSLPTLSAANTGFTRIYNPTLAQVQDLARYLWTDETVVQTVWNHIKQYFEDPMQAIIGFNLVPCSVPNAGSKNFALMYIDTGVSMNVAASQFVDVDCGTVKLERYYGSALDQSPYTRVSCFLPFIGTVRLNTDEVMGTTLSVKYRIDICSGSCVAKVLVDGNVIYQYSGHCAINIPISSADFSSYVSSAITVARLAIGASVAGAAGIGASTVADPEQQTNRTVTVNRTTTTTARNPTTGRQITTGTRTVSETRSFPVKQKEPQDTTQASFNALSPENISNTVGQIMASKPSIEHSGSFSGNTGYLGVRRPYLLIERPNMCMPEQYQQFNGFPAMITMNLSTCKGFTRVYQVQLTGMSATNPEQAEILSLLKSGVHF